ncbi:MAG: CheR family methyltransferase [Candidatus Cyclobacteriaceae bacterium M3_2C_046]
MSTTGIKDVFNTKLTLEEFKRLSVFINTGYGIKMPPEKKTMLQCRLQKRLRELNMSSFSDYCDYIFSEEGQKTELIHMIDVVTTNKTDFFREPAHFDYLTQYVLPEMINKRSIKIWSAGCSSGEEPYTLGIVLSEFNRNHEKLDFSIFGTDISHRILQKAHQAIYPEDRIANIPIDLKKRYFLRSKDPSNRVVKLIREIREKVSYQRLNFMDNYYEVPSMYDLVFCRNVLIYFEKNVQEQVINRLCQKLAHGGYFFLGHSESIMGMKVPLKQIKPTIFQRI